MRKLLIALGLALIAVACFHAMPSDRTNVQADDRAQPLTRSTNTPAPGEVRPALNPVSPEPETSSAPLTEPITAAPEPELRVSAEDYYFGYKRNQVAADQKYRGKRLVVTGVVWMIRKDFRDRPYVEIGPGQQWTSAAYFRRDASSDVAALIPNTQAHIVCTGGGMTFEIPVLSDCSVQRPPEPTEDQREAGTLHKIGGSVLPPVLIYSVEPVYSEDAREARVGGNVLVNLYVDTDGKPIHPKVVRGVGHGLDQAAIDAVSQYRFKPATKNGSPVLVELNVEVRFEIDPAAR